MSNNQFTSVTSPIYYVVKYVVSILMIGIGALMLSSFSEHAGIGIRAIAIATFICGLLFFLVVKISYDEEAVVLGRNVFAYKELTGASYFSALMIVVLIIRTNSKNPFRKFRVTILNDFGISKGRKKQELERFKTYMYSKSSISKNSLDDIFGE